MAEDLQKSRYLPNSGFELSHPPVEPHSPELKLVGANPPTHKFIDIVKVRGVGTPEAFATTERSDGHLKMAGFLPQ